MADEAPKAEKKTKKAQMPDVPPDAPKDRELPTPHEIREAKKAQLVAWAEDLGVSGEGKVDEIRKRLLAHIEKAAKKEAPPEEPPAPKPAKKAAKKPAEKPEKKPAKKERKPAAKPKKEEKEEEAEEEAEYEAKAKPTLDPRIRRLLAIRAAKSAQRPKFRRQEWFRYRRLGTKWRRADGGQSKLRRHFGYRWNVPSIGYRGPREVRGFHPSGFQEVLVHNVRQLEGLDPARQAVRIAHGVGARKREAIEQACDDKGLRVLNRMVTE